MTKMAMTQGASTDTTGELIGLLVPARQSRLRTALACLAVLVALASFAALRSFGVVVPRLRAELQSSARRAARRRDSRRPPLQRRQNRDAHRGRRRDPRRPVAPHSRYPSPPDPHRRQERRHHRALGDPQLPRGHACESRHFRVRARSGLPLATERDYPIRKSDTFVSRLNPPPPPGSPGNEFDTRGDSGGWVMNALQIACEYGR